MKLTGREGEVHCNQLLLEQATHTKTQPQISNSTDLIYKRHATNQLLFLPRCSWSSPQGQNFCRSFAYCPSQQRPARICPGSRVLSPRLRACKVQEARDSECENCLWMFTASPCSEGGPGCPGRRAAIPLGAIETRRSKSTCKHRHLNVFSGRTEGCFYCCFRGIPIGFGPFGAECFLGRHQASAAA